MSEYNYLGEPLFFVGPNGRRNAIVTLFPRYDTIVTLPTVHAFQINAFVEKRKADLVAANLPELTLPEENEMRQSAVPAVIQGDCVHIRPDP